MADAWTIRGPRSDDLPFMLQTYIRTAKGSVPPWERDQVDWDRWDEHATRFVSEMAMANASVVACDPRDPSTLLGYALGERQGDDRANVHWVYVKDPFRRFGIARSLLEHLTKDASTVLVSHTNRAWHRRAAKAAGWRLGRRLHPIHRYAALRKESA